MQKSETEEPPRISVSGADIMKQRHRKGMEPEEELSLKDLMDQKLKKQLIKQLDEGASMQDIVQGTIKPMVEMASGLKMANMLPRIFDSLNMDGDDMGKNNGSYDEMPAWAKELQETNKKLLEKQEAKEREDAIAKGVRDQLAAMGIDTSSYKKKKRSSDDDDDEPMPKWAKEMAAENKGLKTYIEKKEEEEARYRERMEQREELIGIVSETLNERLRPLEARLRNTPNTPEHKSERENLKDTIGMIKEINGMFQPQQADGKEDGFTIKDADAARKMVTGTAGDLMNMWKDVREKDDAPSIWDQQTPQYQADRGQTIDAPKPPEQPIPQDVQQYIDNGHEELIDGKPVFTDEYGHRIPLSGEADAFASKDRMIYEARVNPDMVRYAESTSVRLAETERDQEAEKSRIRKKRSAPQPEPEPEPEPQQEPPPEPQQEEPEAEETPEGETQPQEQEDETNRYEAFEPGQDGDQ